MRATIPTLLDLQDSLNSRIFEVKNSSMEIDPTLKREEIANLEYQLFEVENDLAEAIDSVDTYEVI